MRRRLNLDIIDCISEHAGYIEQDPLSIYYCLFFCIYFLNDDLLEFFRALIYKLKRCDKLEKMMEYIDIYGL